MRPESVFAFVDRTIICARDRSPTVRMMIAINTSTSENPFSLEVRFGVLVMVMGLILDRDAAVSGYRDDTREIGSRVADRELPVEPDGRDNSAATSPARIDGAHGAARIEQDLPWKIGRDPVRRHHTVGRVRVHVVVWICGHDAVIRRTFIVVLQVEIGIAPPSQVPVIGLGSRLVH
jgi:hypothetical protein